MELMIAEFQEKLDVTIEKLVLWLGCWASLDVRRLQMKTLSTFVESLRDSRTLPAPQVSWHQCCRRSIFRDLLLYSTVLEDLCARS